MRGHDGGTATEYAVVARVEGVPTPRQTYLGSLEHQRTFGDPERVADAIETLTTYGWRVVFEEETDGKVTGYLLDLESADVLKSAVGEDFEDAWLSLGINTTPPSEELRREREQRRPDHGTS